MDEAELKQMEKQITELQDEIKKREVECRTLESGKSNPKLPIQNRPVIEQFTPRGVVRIRITAEFTDF